MTSTAEVAGSVIWSRSVGVGATTDPMRAKDGAGTGIRVRLWIRGQLGRGSRAEGASVAQGTVCTPRIPNRASRLG